MPGHPLDEAKIRPLVNRVLAGESLFSVSMSSGVDRNTLRKYVQRAGGIPLKAPTFSPSPIPVHHPKPFEPPVGATVLVIPDLHCPFEHPDSLAFLLAVRKTYRTTATVCLGDEADFCAFSRFPRDPDGMSPGGELAAAIEHLIPFYKAFPDVLVCTSNHTVRPMKSAFLAGLPQAFWPTYSTLLNAPDGWRWEDYYLIDGVRYFHGEGKSGFNAHLAFLRAYKTSVCHGHVHSGAAVSHEGSLFAVNSGCLIDVRAYAFRYAKHMPIPVSLGCSVIFGGKRAIFIPLQTDAHGRWTGKL